MIKNDENGSPGFEPEQSGHNESNEPADGRELVGLLAPPPVVSGGLTMVDGIDAGLCDGGLCDVPWLPVRNEDAD